MQALLQLYSRRLTNLTGSNRSLLLRRLKQDHFLDLHELSYLQPNKPAFLHIEKLLEAEPSIVGPVFDPRDEHLNRVSRRLKQIARTTRFISEERGSQDLYVGWPFVQGRFADDTPVRCPLLFYPVELIEDNQEWKLIPREGVAVQLNKSFMLAYAHYQQTNLPEKLYEKNFTDWDKDSRVFRTKLYSLLKDSPLTINFNQELFLDELQAFPDMNAADLLEITASGELKLLPQAVLGIFPQAGSYLVPDYNLMLEELPARTLEELFFQRFRGSAQEASARHSLVELGYQVREETMLTPYALDSSQEVALRAIKAGASLVVQGPPGTGKSQLIANVVADFAARGKRVLVVSQKKAALDVVFQRLHSKDLGHFVGLVHDFKGDRKRLYQQVSEQIERVGEYKNMNNGLDTIQLERSFQKLSRRIEQIKEELRAFKDALFNREEYGLSVKELYLSTETTPKLLDLRQEFKHYPLIQAEEFLRKVSRYQQLSASMPRADHPWSGRKSFHGFDLHDQQQMLEIIQEIHHYRQSITQAISQHLHQDITFETVEYLLLREEDIKRLIKLLEKPEIYQNLQHMLGYRQNSISEEQLTKIERSLMQCYEGEGPEITLPSQQLGRYQDLLHNRLRASRSLYKLLRWKFFVAEQAQVQDILHQNGLQDRRRDVHVLIRRLDNRLNLEHNLSKIKSLPWLTGLPQGYKKLDLQQWFGLQRKTLRAWNLLHAIRNLNLYFNIRKLSFTELKQKVEELIKLLNQLEGSKVNWLQYFTSLQIEQMLAAEAKTKAMALSLEQDFDQLVELDQLLDGLGQDEQMLMQRIQREAEQQQVPPEGVKRWFMNSLQTSWIQHIENKFPVLRSVSTQGIQELEKELRQCLADKQALSQDMMLLRIREQTYQDMEFNRLNNQVTFRDLKHQVSKKRKVWPIRKLVNQFDEELMRLIPCWMASPEAVSAIFPLRELFDLVIFDEASQCFVEKGLPAIVRSRQVLVSGDSQQLQPNDLYQVRWDEEDGDEPDTEIESLLDLATRYLPATSLQGHYRSHLPELIHFSNQHFYQFKLEMVPDRQRINKNETGISFVKVRGLWDQNTNHPEAEEVVRLVLTLLAIEREQEFLSGKEGVPWYHPKSIGVVTFNARQQSLIQEMLEASAAEQQIRLPESLFVKNIENVQGDERDIIIFSVGYAPDSQGNMRMQFGSLNTAHGENRLNVAITRAREAIYVVSSIEPEELQVANSKHEGPKLFRAYLEYARQVSRHGFTPKPNPEVVKSYSLELHDKIAYELESPEYEIRPIQPFADLTARHLGKYGGVILTDDNLYYNSPTLKKSHVYLYNELEQKHWPHLRIYSREYWKNKSKLFESINRYLNHLDAQS